MYAITCLPEKEPWPAYIEWRNNVPAKGTNIILLQTGETVKWTNENGNIRITLAPHMLNAKTNYGALAFSFTSADNN